MKERWSMCRAANLKPGDVVWIGVKFTLTAVKPRIGVTLKGKTADGRGDMKGVLPRDMYLPVLKTPAPPEMPVAPPTRYISDYCDALGLSWWHRLQDWLNGR